MASIETIAIIKATAPVLEQHGETITQVFYQRLFEEHPALQNIFNMTHQRQGTQPKVLAMTIFKYACHIDQLALLGDAVETIAQKHSSLSITKEMYPIVGKHLLAAIQEVLGAAATPAIIDAWAEAYQELAVIFTEREEALYAVREKVSGGFRGTKEFVVIRKEKESGVITSLYLQPKDGATVPVFTAGQYIALTLSIPGHPHTYTRNYSLSDSPDQNYWRISVKKEIGTPAGIVSNYIHEHISVGDMLTLGMPAGNFVLQEHQQPLVLISGGVGITPLMSMYTTALKNPRRKISFIQCAVNSTTSAFEAAIAKQATSHTQQTIVYSDPLASDTYDYKGIVSTAILQERGIDPNSDFYFCGPVPFMKHTIQLLQAYGVATKNIHYEFFGPSETMEAAIVQ